MNEYMFFIKWRESSQYNPEGENEFGKLIKVRAASIIEAQSKIHKWAKGTKYEKANIEYFEEGSTIQVIE